jgi:predicted nucleic acid-binding Zn ribbon protein
MPREFVPPTDCPVCGEPVPRGARACPGCGADERSGWNEAAALYDGLDLPDEAGHEQPGPRRQPAILWPVVGLLTLVAVIIAFVFR